MPGRQEKCTEFGAIVLGMYLPFISGSIKHIVKHLFTVADLFILTIKGQKKYNTKQIQAPGETKQAKKSTSSQGFITPL